MGTFEGKSEAEISKALTNDNSTISYAKIKEHGDGKSELPIALDHSILSSEDLVSPASVSVAVIFKDLRNIPGIERFQYISFPVEQRYIDKYARSGKEAFLTLRWETSDILKMTDNIGLHTMMNLADTPPAISIGL